MTGALSPRQDGGRIILTLSHQGRLRDEAVAGTMLETAHAWEPEPRQAWSGV